MTNRELIKGLLESESFVDDGGATYEAMVYYNIACPYYEGDWRAHCDGKEYEDVNREMCTACKDEWLDREVDE